MILIIKKIHLVEIFNKYFDKTTQVYEMYLNLGWDNIIFKRYPVSIMVILNSNLKSLKILIIL